jgi:hypothetical protein
MLLNLTDAASGHPVAINPEHVVVLFVAKDDAGVERTVLNMLNGNVAVGEDYLTVYGMLQSELK